jgi:hypothetical protein
MRMYPEQARELFDLVPVGTPARIIYQLASIGYSPEEGIVYIAHHPNPYQRPDITAAKIMKQLAGDGLAEVAETAAIEAELKRTRGLPVPIVGSTTKLVVGGRPVSLALGPIRVGEEWLAPVGPLAEALGAYLEIASDGSSVSVEREGRRLTLFRDKTEALLNGVSYSLAAPMRLAAGYPLAPVKTVATALGASVGWDNETKTILVWSSRATRQPGWFTPPGNG